MNHKLLCTAAAAVFAVTSAASAADFTMKIAHVVPPGDPRDLGANRVTELLAADQSCSIDAKVFPSAQLGGTADLIEGMQIGAVEAVVLPASFLVGFEPKVGIFDFPYFWPSDYADLKKIHEGPAMAKLLKTTESKGVVSLGVWHTGYKEWTANKPLVEKADYDGLKSRVMPSPILVEQQKLLGLTPVSIPFPETYSALQNGVIDAQENPLVTSFVMKFHEVQSNVTMTNHGTLDQLFMVSKAWWEALTPECRAAVDGAVAEASGLVVEKTQTMEKKALDAFAERGVVVTAITEEQRQVLREATLPQVEKAYIAQNGEEGEAILASFKAEMGMK